MQLTNSFKQFFNSEKASGIVLLACTIISLYIANSDIKTEYLNIWNFSIFSHSISHWINDGLMAIFFLLIGLELERELYNGELSNFKQAQLPIYSAIGGMLVPALIYYFFNKHSNSVNGFGIPMATDIAFSIGVLALLGKRVPASLKVFLTALAVIDDLGAILVIALFYTKTIIWTNLALSLGFFGLMLVLNRLKVYKIVPYIILGIAMWFFMLNSGIHATISGILFAFAMPFGKGDEMAPSHKLQKFLHIPVSFIIIPLFALANTAIVIGGNWQEGLMQASSIGILAGLLLGKPLGIILFSFITVSLGICTLPKHVNWKQLLGVGFLAGIGFTMSIFITLLAFENELLINTAKLAILVASLLSMLLGFVWLKLTLLKPESLALDEDELE